VGNSSQKEKSLELAVSIFGYRQHHGTLVIAFKQVYHREKHPAMKIVAEVYQVRSDTYQAH
jgi:hypothetical protein